MKIATVTLPFCCFASNAWAFSPLVSFGSSIRNKNLPTVLSSTVVDVGGDISTADTFAKNKLIETAHRLKNEYGVLLIEKSAKEELQSAVEDLENLSEPPAMESYKDNFIGEWTLVCTTASSQEGVDTSKLPLFDIDPIKKIRQFIRDNANKYLKVQQIIKSTKEDGEIDRIDHVIEYDPPAKLQEMLDNVPPQLANLNLNPFEVSESKISLIHKATIVTEVPLVTKLGLTGISLNIAGTSTFLEPDGKDVAGINLPLGEFVNTGEFETTYMDETLRISRGKQGFVEQLRVFIRTQKEEELQALDEVLAGPEVGAGVSSDMDVDDGGDPEFDETTDTEDEEDDADDI